jgi:hypothetical protein
MKFYCISASLVKSNNTVTSYWIQSELYAARYRVEAEEMFRRDIADWLNQGFQVKAISTKDITDFIVNH